MLFKSDLFMKSFGIFKISLSSNNKILLHCDYRMRSHTSKKYVCLRWHAQNCRVKFIVWTALGAGIWLINGCRDTMHGVLERSYPKLDEHRLQLVQTDGAIAIGVILFEQSGQSLAIYLVIAPESWVRNKQIMRRNLFSFGSNISSQAPGNLTI